MNLTETINLILWMGLSALAIDNLTDILTTVDLLEKPRLWFQVFFPRLRKLAACAYCQAWWLCIPTSIIVVMFPELKAPQVIIVAFAMHRMIQASSEFFDRYRGRAPLNVFATVVRPDDHKEETK
jgi:hypothetical protein